MLRPLRRLAAMGLMVVALVLWIWGKQAVGYSNLPGETLRGLAGWTYTLGTLGLFLFLPSLWKAGAAFLGISGVLIVWWLFIPASNDRDWVPDLARQPHATVVGELVTMHDIRDFDWKSATDDFVVNYYDETFDLKLINEVDLVICYWDEQRAIAHTIISFGFTDGKHVAVSIEIRREKNESYNTIKGLYKQFELYYVVASETDVVKVRTNQRGEEVYLHPTRATPEQARALFLSYVVRINKLAEDPEYYHTIFNNCTTNIVDHVNEIMPTPLPFQQKVLLNGYSDELAYDMGWLDDSVPYADLRRKHYISKIVQAADSDPDFSARIREFPEK
jgi:hypothetical protein